MKPSTRSSVAPFYVMEVMRAAEQRELQGGRVLHLEVGQPSTPAPKGALAAAKAAIDQDRLGYTGAAGLPQLRERISLWYRERYGVEVPASRIVITTGASGSCVLAFLALFDVGERVGVVEPGYPCYRNDLLALGVDAVTVPVGHDTSFRLTVDRLEAAGALDGLVVASPSNPTGTVLPPAELEGLVCWAAANDVRLVVDEIYHGITFGAEVVSALAYSDQIVVFNSFSKFFSMTGWRVGWVVAPDEMILAIERLAQSLMIAPPTIGQHAALAAFDCLEELEANVARYRENRDLLIEGLKRAGVDRIAPPDGAFYIWADVSHLGLDSQELCRRWLDELGIAATPGIDFDVARGHDFVRFSYAGAADEIVEAGQRLAAWTASHQA